MKPYYSHAGITIFHGDCREILPHVKADVVVTDPPYGMAYESGWCARPIVGDGDTAIRDAMLRLWGSRPAVVFGRWSEPKPEGVVARLVWDKGEWPGMGDLSFPWGPSDEEIYVLGEGFSGHRTGTIIRTNRLNGSRLVHPNEKPVAVMRHLIERCPAGVILDPFMGSGTTLVAAKQLGRQAIGIEISERYCEIAAKRLAQEVLPLEPPEPEPQQAGLL